MGLAVVVIAVPALGQAGGSEMPRGFVGGLTGATLGDAPTSVVFAAQGGVRLGGGLLAIGEFGQMQNVLPPEFQAELDVIARIVGLEGGGNLTLAGRLTALYGLGGVRWMGSTARWAPFVEGGAGMTRLRIHVDPSRGNSMLASDIEQELRADNPDTTATKPVATVGGGINIRAASRWSVDAGYRYYRIFTDAPAANVNSLYGALKFHF
jgi:hypothetical protein